MTHLGDVLEDRLGRKRMEDAIVLCNYQLAVQYFWQNLALTIVHLDDSIMERREGLRDRHVSPPSIVRMIQCAQFLLPSSRQTLVGRLEAVLHVKYVDVRVRIGAHHLSRSAPTLDA